MRKLINIVINYKEYISFTALVVISLSLISMGEVSRLGGFRAVVIGGTGWLQEAFAWIPNPAALKSENRALRELNMQLSSEVIRMRKSLIENDKLRNMVSLRDTSSIGLISAEVVGKSAVQMRNYITLNKGGKDGIKEGMPVRTDAGLVGIVISAGSGYSMVEMLSNRSVRISARDINAELDGIVVWDGGEYLLMQNVPQSFTVNKGDVVTTSNYSNKYPQDIPIGKIIKIEKESNSLFYKIVIEPYARFSSLEQVFVVNKISDPLKFKLVKQLEERLLDRKKAH